MPPRAHPRKRTWTRAAGNASDDARPPLASRAAPWRSSKRSAPRIPLARAAHPVATVDSHGAPGALSTTGIGLGAVAFVQGRGNRSRGRRARLRGPARGARRERYHADHQCPTSHEARKEPMPKETAPAAFAPGESRGRFLQGQMPSPGQVRREGAPVVRGRDRPGLTLRVRFVPKERLTSRNARGSPTLQLRAQPGRATTRPCAPRRAAGS
jgi:hypothetical protein